MKGAYMRMECIDQELEELAANNTLRNNKWSEEETKLLRKYYLKIPTSQLAKKLGRSPASIRNKAGNEGLMGANA